MDDHIPWNFILGSASCCVKCACLRTIMFVGVWSLCMVSVTFNSDVVNFVFEVSSGFV